MAYPWEKPTLAARSDQAAVRLQGPGMLSVVNGFPPKKEIASICAELGVRRLELFGCGTRSASPREGGEPARRARHPGIRTCHTLREG